MDLYDLLFQILFLIFFAATGLCLGSFATAIIHREKAGQPWFSLKGEQARSQCPHCKSVLGIQDLVPFFSWLFLKGKCRHCGAGVSVFYPLMEILCAGAAVLIFVFFGVGVLSLTGLLILPFLVSFVFLSAFYRTFSLRLLLIIVFIGFLSFLGQIAL